MIPQPKNQLQEVFYLLLKNKTFGMTRLDFMNKAYVMNAPEAISKLRRRGVGIETIPVDHTNKFGRVVTYSVYKLTNYERAEKQYRSICSSKPVSR